MQIIQMTIDHYQQVLELMKNTSGITIRDVDSREAIEKYLCRNPGLSFLAISNGKVIGCALCGHDGRRGYLQHVIVAPQYRKQGIASRLVQNCLEKLQEIGIYKTHIDVLVDNHDANRYWMKRGWILRTDINRYSFNMSSSANP